jgi:hypothetical protein
MATWIHNHASWGSAELGMEWQNLPTQGIICLTGCRGGGGGLLILGSCELLLVGLRGLPTCFWWGARMHIFKGIFSQISRIGCGGQWTVRREPLHVV